MLFLSRGRLLFHRVFCFQFRAFVVLYVDEYGGKDGRNEKRV